MHSLMHKLERGDYMSRVLKHNVGDDVLIIVRGHIKNISISSADDCCYVVEVDDPATRQDSYKDLLYFSEKALEDHEYIEPIGKQLLGV